MDAQLRRCLRLIDDADNVVSQSRMARKEGSRCVISRARRGSPRSLKFVQTKIYLLEALRTAFIESRTKSIRLSKLLMFCFHNGFELVTHTCIPHIRVCFVLRTPDFDIRVESC